MKTIKNQKPKAKGIEAFFGKFYIVIFAVLLFACAAVKMAFTLSRNSAASIWKFVLIFDTITTLLLAASFFLFYMSSDTKSKEGTKIAAVTFLVTSVLSVFTQIAALIYYMRSSLNIVVTFLFILGFLVQSLFLLNFAIHLTRDVFKKRITAKGALGYAGTKATTMVAALIISFVKTSKLDQFGLNFLVNFNSPFIESNATDTIYPTLALITILVSCLVMISFSLLYNKFALKAQEEQSEN